ncbi:MAG: 16S rRNA (uracil(1498)-N(3))-methyltransferase [Bryobacterales bacterium]|nr:16S rRNA (uracil(1498)-N(3))-methyltransferase [Bryobacterales bacterium]
MARRRFFVDKVARGGAEVCGDDALHLTRVLRVEAGETYEISDNERVYLAEVTLARKNRVEFRTIEELPVDEPVVRLTLYAALIKFDRFEWIVEKATELGVETIVPVDTVRCEKGLAQAAEKRVERWRKIARESSQQSRRARMPVIEDPRQLNDVAYPVSTGFALDEKPGLPALGAVLPPGSTAVSLLVGPEGGWTDAEREWLPPHGWTGVSLGRQILRAETAAIAALSVVAHAGYKGA